MLITGIKKGGFRSIRANLRPLVVQPKGKQCFHTSLLTLCEAQETTPPKKTKTPKPKPANFDLVDFEQPPPISDQTSEKVDSMTEDERAQHKALLLVLGTQDGQRVICFDGVKDMTVARWYKDVDIKHVPENDKWLVCLDDQPIYTRQNKPLFLPTEEAAMLVASDWDVQEGLITYSSLPFTLAAVKSIDDQSVWGEYYHTETLEYIETDHLCYRDPSERPIYETQEALYNPILKWFTETTGLELARSQGISQDHPQHTIDSIVVLCLKMEPQVFLQFIEFVGNTKSIILALAVWHNHISTQEAIHAARLEEDVQEARHGTIEGGHDYHRALDEVAFCCGALSLYTCGQAPPGRAYFEAMGDPYEFLQEREIERVRNDIKKYKKFLQIGRQRKTDIENSGVFHEFDEAFFKDADNVYTGLVKKSEDQLDQLLEKRDEREKQKRLQKIKKE